MNIRQLIYSLFLLFLGLSISTFTSCGAKGEKTPGVLAIDSTEINIPQQMSIMPGAESMAEYIPILKNKKVALVVNHSSRVGDQHLLDTLLALEINVVKIFTPEHGFTGTADAGEIIDDSTLEKRDLIPIISLYGEKRIPSDQDMEGVDVLVFDIQDVGARFYTYISTLHYVMEASAENNVAMLILDRPNPNGHYVDGPVLDLEYQSFVGMHPIPVVHGLTVGELAGMINGEAWLKNGIACDLTVIENKNYSHLMHYELPIFPSPNLKDSWAINLYPSLCFFEGTPVSVGRGTDRPFTVIGHPAFTDFEFSFIPEPDEGSAKPKHQGQSCYGYDLGSLSLDNFRGKSALELKWLFECYSNWGQEEAFFNENGWFDKLAGSDEFRKMILDGKTEEEIRASWEPKLNEYKLMRKKYLLYPDFE